MNNKYKYHKKMNKYKNYRIKSGKINNYLYKIKQVIKITFNKMNKILIKKIYNNKYKCHNK